MTDPIPPSLAGVGPGTVLAVRGDNITGELIRFGAALVDKPNLSNHIAVVHHIDPGGVVWGIEGRPGGVGWVDCHRYLVAEFTITNRKQPMTPQQRSGVSDYMKEMLGTPYDYSAIFEDAALDLHLPELYAERWNGESPGHVVCSSVASYAYGKQGLANPVSWSTIPPLDYRHVQPGDWDAFIFGNHYN